VAAYGELSMATVILVGHRSVGSLVSVECVVLHGVVLGHGGPRNSWITICVVGWVHGSPVHFCLAWHRGSSRTGIWFSHPLARACGRWQDRTALQSSRAPITRPSSCSAIGSIIGPLGLGIGGGFGEPAGAANAGAFGFAETRHPVPLKQARWRRVDPRPPGRGAAGGASVGWVGGGWRGCCSRVCKIACSFAWWPG
jgi:hypothetical protein